jgi:RNA polymerase primary sigma factor
LPRPKAKTKEKKLDPKKIKKEIKAISKGEKKAADKGASTKSKTTGKKVAPSKPKKVSKVSSGSISMYLAEIGKYNPLPPEREVELAIRIQNNDEAAMKELVEANLRFVVSVAKKYQGNGLSLADIINEGNLGLIKAAKRFDHTK